MNCHFILNLNRILSRKTDRNRHDGRPRDKGQEDGDYKPPLHFGDRSNNHSSHYRRNVSSKNLYTSAYSKTVGNNSLISC